MSEIKPRLYKGRTGKWILLRLYRHLGFAAQSFETFEEARSYIGYEQRKALSGMQLREQGDGFRSDSTSQGILHDAVVSSGRLTRLR